MPHYIAFGLTINADIELQDLIPQCVKQSSDLKINHSTLTAPLTQSQLHIQPHYAELTIAGIARYQVKQGKSISIQQCPTAKTADVQLFLFGSVMGLVLQQLDRLLLHACAVEHQGRAYLFAAHSGVGKSTLAYGLYQRGYRILTDDVACITYAAGQPIIYPGYPRLRVTQASADALKADTSNAPTVVTCDKKYILSCHDNWQTTPLPVAHFTVIEPNANAHVFESDILGAIKILQLKQHSYRYGYLAAQQKLVMHFKQISQLAQTVPIILIRRPSEEFKIQELIQCVEKRIQGQRLPV